MKFFGLLSLIAAATVSAKGFRSSSSSSSSSHSSSDSHSHRKVAEVTGSFNTFSSSGDGLNVLGITSGVITEPWILRSNGIASGAIQANSAYPVSDDCTDLMNPECERKSNFYIGEIKCLSVSGNAVWFSAEVTGRTNDVRDTDENGYVTQVLIQEKPYMYVGKLIDNGDLIPDERSLFQMGSWSQPIDGRDNIVAPIGEVTSVNWAFYGETAKTFCKKRDEMLANYEADLMLLCNSVDPEDCAYPRLDANSVSGYVQHEFDRFVANTVIQWLDENGEPLNMQPVPNTVANAYNPPAEARYVYGGDVTRVFVSGNIKLEKY